MMFKNRLIALFLLSAASFIPISLSFGHGNHGNGNSFGHCHNNGNGNGNGNQPWWVNGHCNNPQIVLTELQELTFGTIAPNNSQSGAVVVSPHINSSSTCAPALTCLEPGNRAIFKIEREISQVLSVSLPNSIFLVNPQGDKMKVKNFQTNYSSSSQFSFFAPGTGPIYMGIGAKLNVKPQQPRGTYRGTFEFTVEYN